VLPPPALLQRSTSRVNISYIYNDVRFTDDAAVAATSAILVAVCAALTAVWN
jgi:hypothetical protein